MSNQTTIIYGVYSGISTFIVFISLYIFNINPLGNYSWIGAFIPVIFIPLGSIKARNDLFEGYISYGKCLLNSLIITFSWALSFAILAFVFIWLIAPEIMDWHIQELLVNMEKAEQFLDGEMFENAMSEIEGMSLFEAIQGDFINKIFGGLIISLISSAFVKKSKPIFE